MKRGNSYLVLPMIVFAFFVCGCDSAENTVPVPGRSDAFDPVGSLPAVASFAGEEMLLIELYAQYVRPDGTLNLQAEYGPNVRYEFFGPGKPASITPEPRKPDTPLGVRQKDGPKEQAPYWAYVSVYIENPHWEEYTLNGEDVTEWYAGMRKAQGSSLQDITEIEKLKGVYRGLPAVLPLDSVWKRAIEAGAPMDNVVATIQFKDGTYHFIIDGTTFEYYFDRDGALLRK